MLLCLIPAWAFSADLTGDWTMDEFECAPDFFANVQIRIEPSDDGNLIARYVRGNDCVNAADPAFVATQKDNRLFGTAFLDFRDTSVRFGEAFSTQLGTTADANGGDRLLIEFGNHRIALRRGWQAPKCPVNVSGQGRLFYTCDCSAVAAAANAPVVGADMYSFETPICAAAAHSGVVSTSGGLVTVIRAPANGICPYFFGRPQNGIRSDAGGQAGAYYFEGLPGLCDAGSPPEPASLGYCLATYSSYVDALRDTKIRCHCSDRATGMGEIWGDGTYTGHSSICRAARHAGAVGVGGGAVEILPITGPFSYSAATRNGIDSAAFGPFGFAFGFEP